MFFEPQFYESHVSMHLTALGYRVERNARVPILGSRWSAFPEVDALAWIEGATDEPTFVEVKSYPLSMDDIEHIIAKYRRLTPNRIFIAAPLFPPRAALRHGLECIEFSPDLGLLRQYYEEKFVQMVPESIMAALATGLHHVRYLMPTRAASAPHRFMNQIDKRLRSPGDIQKEILRRLPTIPSRVFWTTQKLRNPKWYYWGEGSPIDSNLWACDIDGTSLHQGITPCKYDMSNVCSLCYSLADVVRGFVRDVLDDEGIAPVLEIDSGRRGYHIYVSSEARSLLLRPEMVTRCMHAGARLDYSTLRASIPLVGFPGSLHGYSMRPVAAVTKESNDVHPPSLPYRRV